MRLSVVATLYKSEPYLLEFHTRVTAAAKAFAGGDYEIILVNDGSPDASLDMATALVDIDPHVVVVDLSRNFGHHKAMMTGLQAAVGDFVFLIDSDLEEQPEWLASFFEQLHTDKADVVFGVQSVRKGGAFERFTGAIFYKLFRLLTGVDQPDNIVTARLMTRRYVEALVAHRERELNIGGLWVITGFKQARQLVVKGSTSPTTYTISRKIGHLVNAVTSFSSLPLVFSFYFGLIVVLTASVFIARLGVQYVLGGAPPAGYISIIASIWLFSGLIIFFMGIQGIYIAKVFSEVKSRPYTIVRQIHRRALSPGDLP